VASSEEEREQSLDGNSLDSNFKWSSMSHWGVLKTKSAQRSPRIPGTNLSTLLSLPGSVLGQEEPMGDRVKDLTQHGFQRATAGPKTVLARSQGTLSWLLHILLPEFTGIPWPCFTVSLQMFVFRDLFQHSHLINFSLQMWFQEPKDW
jgi:hypothetical protein